MVIDRSVRDLFASDGLAWAAALAFYTLLSFFPLVIVVIIVASYVTDPQWVGDRIVNGVNQFVPGEQIDPTALVAGARRERERLGIIAVVVVLFTGRRALGTLILSLDRMSDVDQGDESFRRKAGTEATLIVGVAAAAIMAVATRPVLSFVERSLGREPAGDDRLTWVVVELAQTLLIFGAFALVYAVVPLGKRMWRAVLIASASATALFLVTRAAFTALVDLLWETLSTLYGPFAAAAFLLTWVYWVALIVLFGASLSSHIKVMSLEGARVHETERRHVARTEDPSAEPAASEDRSGSGQVTSPSRPRLPSPSSSSLPIQPGSHRC